MNIGMTVYNNHSIDDSTQATVPLPVSNSRGATLNPEASVFRLPAQQQSNSTTTHAVDGEPKQKQVHLFMNGDVGKEVCGEQCPPTEPLCQKTSSEKDMSNSSENVFGSSSPSEKMTEAIALPKEMQKEGDCTESSSIGECDVMNGSSKEMDEDKVDDDSQEDKDDTGQERENHDDASQSALPAAQAEKASSEPLTREQIKELLGQNIEFFFSRENWSSDPYLCSQMDNDQYVPVFILANCSQFKSITKDHSIIMEALKDSVFVQLDEENNRVRPNYQRCIVILREIPRSTPVEDIQAMFKGEGCPKVINCEFVHNDFWYVTFDSDSDAQKAYRYLRETVKTFKDKPILARIKTKPMSRLRCPSVLPSCKTPGGESREGSVAMQGSGNVNSGATPPGVATAGPSGIQGLPTPHPPPNSYPNNSQRMFFAPQNINNPGYHNYNFTGSAAQIPAAYFYPNPIMHAQWNNPSGSFYDINSFIQYNGLSPRAAFKPPPNTRFTNSNGNATRRTKNRETKFDKNEPRHLSSASNGGGSGVGSQLRHNQSTSRPQSAQSPQLLNQAATPNSNLHHSLASSQIPAVQLSHHLPKGESQPNFNTILTSSINNNSNVVHTSHNSFAQNDISLTSQSNLYTSFSSPAGINIPRGNNNTIKVEKPEKEELGSHAALESTEVSNFEGSCSENSEIVVSIAADTLNAVASGSSTSNISTTSSSVVTNSINSNQQISVINQQLPHHHHYHQSMPVSHRCPFNNESHIPSREQPQRQMSRGGRRRVPRRDEDTNGHTGSGNGRGSQRGAAAQNINGDLQSKTAEIKKPFELQSVSFPPLPSADEVVVSPPEEKIVESSQVAWSGEPHKFSDVMKGTAKPKHFTTPSVPTTEKESVVDVVSPPQSTVSVAELNGKPSEENVPSPNLETSTVENTNHNNNNCTVNASSSNIISGNNSISSTISSKNSSESSQVVTTSVVRQERPSSVRDDRRPAGMQVIRREREFIPGIGRGGSSRRERDAGNFRTSGNKENRPQTGSNRSWREDRADPDGWITKGPREREHKPHRDHRYQNQHSGQHNYYESRNFNSKSQTIVNGDASPPPPPKPVTTTKPSEISSNKSSATTTNSIKNFPKQESKPVKPEVMVEKVKDDGNNDGEHKTSWAKMALASKDKMEQLSAQLKEKEEQERQKKRNTKSTQKVPERISVGREREGKPFRRENFSPREREKELTEKGGGGREFRGGPERNATFGFKPREALRPKSPK